MIHAYTSLICGMGVDLIAESTVNPPPPPPLPSEALSPATL
jgi:hypothetical protein